LEACVADQAMGDLFALGRDGLAAHPCVGPERVEFVLPGCAVYAAIRQVWQVPSLTVADRGLREGMLIRMMRADAAAMSRHAGRGPLVRDLRTQPHPPPRPAASRLDP
jgi:exopolyphosphatase/guanosine-5'-triphosphate,3'-diphosphate pyrophosphatase